MAKTFKIPPGLIHAGAFSADLMQDLMNIFAHSMDPDIFSANGAIDPHLNSSVVITKTSACALTLAAPTAGDDDGHTIRIVSTTAFAHTVVVTGFKMGVTGSNLKVTFAAFAGCSLYLYAYQGAWYLLSMNGGTCS